MMSKYATFTPFIFKFTSYLLTPNSSNETFSMREHLNNRITMSSGPVGPVTCDQGRRTKIGQGGGRIIWTCEREVRAKIPPPPPERFPLPLAMIFTPLYFFL